MEFILARVAHVIGVVLWIGGVAMVATVLLPAIMQFKSASERVGFFQLVERRFAWQARFTTLITGVSGFYMLYLLHGWSRYVDPHYWWVHAMTLTWVLFTVMLFVLEPLVLHQHLAEQAQSDPEGAFRRIRWIHWVLLALSLVTIAGAVAGSHGLSF